MSIHVTFEIHFSPLGDQELSVGKCPLMLSEEGCRKVAEERKLPFGVETKSDWPSGCYYSTKVLYNKAMTDIECDRAKVKWCFCKGMLGSSKNIYNTLCEFVR